MRAGTAPRRLRQRHDADAGSAVHRQLLRGGAGKIDDPSTMVGPPVVDCHQDRLAVLEVGHPGLGAERQTPVGGGEGLLVEAFAAGGLFAVKTGSVPGRLARLDAARAHCEGNGGEGKGDRQHDGRNRAKSPAGPAWQHMALVAFVHERTSSVGSWRPPSLGGGGDHPELEKRHEQSVPRFPRCMSTPGPKKNFQNFYKNLINKDKNILFF